MAHRESEDALPVSAAPTYLEFFAGGGLARIGLGAEWRCLFANDVDAGKCAAYRANFAADEIVEGDIAGLRLRDLPKERADLAWASFPCQDLSLAGGRNGLAGERSGLFFEFMRHMDSLKRDGRAPRTLAIENVVGLLTSKGGADFARVAEAIAGLGYGVSALVLNASSFTPQSRPRLFVFGFSTDAAPPFGMSPSESDPACPPALRRVVEALPHAVARAWRWLAPRPSGRANLRLADILEPAPDWSRELGDKALASMSARQRAAIDEIARAGSRAIGAAFFRIRIERGVKVQRLEARFDGLAGCLRTPAGGSSRQLLLLVEKNVVLARRLSPREAARLMGVPDDYILPGGTTAALKLMGDGVAPPVVRWIAGEIIEPALRAQAAAA